jgi:hypothetical protein
MGRAADSPLESRLRQVGRRLSWQHTADRYAAAVPVLGVSFLVAAVVLPLAWPLTTAAQFASLVGCTLLAFVVAERFVAARRRPTLSDSAHELDKRFGLSERATTAVSLDDGLRQSPAGRALWLDASSKAEQVRVKDRFAITYSRRLWSLPILLSAAALCWAYLRAPLQQAVLGAAPGSADAAKPPEVPPKAPAPKPALKIPADRAGKSEELKKLEAEIDELYNAKNKDKSPSDDSKSPGESVRDQIEKVAEKQEKLRKLEQAKIEQLRKMTEQLGKMDSKLSQPGDDTYGLQEALSKGQFDKAKDEIDKLKKKVKEMKPEDARKLQKEMEKLTEEIEKLSRDQKKKDELQRAIDKAKQEGRDADSLEREMQKLEQDARKMEQLQQLAKKMKAAAESLKEQKMEQAADQLGDAPRA